MLYRRPIHRANCLGNWQASRTAAKDLFANIIIRKRGNLAIALVAPDAAV